MAILMKWLLRLALGLVALVVLAAVLIYVASSWKLSRTYDVQLVEIDVPDDAASLAKGRHLAITRGCYLGCHADLGGEVMFEDPLFGRITAPNITQAIRNYTDAQLAGFLRSGVRPDGTTVIGIMPFEAYRNLARDDVAAIIAFLRSQPPIDNEPPRLRLGPIARMLVLLEPGFLAATGLAGDTNWAPPDPANTGEYIAMTTCIACHGSDLHGGPEGAPDAGPDLVIAKAYSLETFTRLLREGVPADGRELGLMKEVAVHNLSHLTDAEIEALHTWLQEL